MIHVIYLILFNRLLSTNNRCIRHFMFFKQLQQLIIDVPSIIFSIKQGLINKVTNDNSDDDNNNSDDDNDNTFKYEYDYQYTYTINEIEGIDYFYKRTNKKYVSLRIEEKLDGEDHCISLIPKYGTIKLKHNTNINKNMKTCKKCFLKKMIRQ